MSPSFGKSRRRAAEGRHAYPESVDQSQPERPDLSQDDLQRSPEQDPGAQRFSSAALQDAIAEVVAVSRGWALEEAIHAVEDALARRGQPPQPPRWVEAVAMGAISGRTYVVNEQALHDAGIEVPAHDAVQRSAGRDRGKDPA